MLRRKLFVAAAAAYAFLPRTLLAQSAQGPLRIVFPFGAGSAGDAFARVMAERLRVELDRPVIVENKTGAGGRIGVQAVRAAAADGSTLLWTPIAPISVYPHTYASLGYDPFADFQPVAQLATFDMALAVGASVPARTIEELVAWLRANPSRGTFTTPGAGTLPHFLGIQFARTAGIELVHAPARGSAPALADVMAGHLPIIVTSTNEIVSPHRDGRVRALATSGSTRSPFLPDVSTFKELGLRLEAYGWFAVFVPAGTPGDTVDRLNRALVAALRTPEVTERLKSLWLIPTGTSAAELARIMRADWEFWGPAIKASGFTADQ